MTKSPPPIVPLEIAEIRFAGSRPLLVEQLSGASVLTIFHRGLDVVHFRGIEGFKELFAGGEGVVFLSIGSVSLTLSDLLVG